MLVLTRRAEEKIQIGDNIVISVLEVEGGSVKIGIEAPKEIQIFRMEIIEQIRNENIQAAEKATVDIDQAVELFQKKLGKEQGD